MAEREGIEIPTFEDAIASALEELGEAPPTEPEVTQPVTTEESEPLIEEAPEEEIEEPSSEADTEELFDEEDLVEEEEEQITDLESLTFELPGVEKPVSMQGLKDGFLRQSDYTRKTQEVKKQRQEASDALNFWNALRSDPVGVLQQLAAEAGLIEEGQAPARKVEFSPLATAEQVEAEIAKRVEETVDQHPLVQQAAQTQAVAAIDAEFERIEGKYEQKLGPKSRQAILERASRAGTPDLEIVFNSMLAEQQRRRDGAQTLKAAAPKRPTGRAVETEITEPADSVEAAFKRAEVELGVE
jgi:hypothetical protein